MNETTTTITTTPAEILPTTARFGTTDHRSELRAAMRIAERTVAGVDPDTLNAPTPCTQLDVDQVIGHLVQVGQRLEALYQGLSEDHLDTVKALGLGPIEASEVLAAQNATVEQLLSDDALLDRIIVPWRPMSVRESLPLYVSEYTVHTWDLAAATATPVDWDLDVIALSHEAMECEIPAQNRAALFAPFLEMAPEGTEAPFGEACDVPDDASPIERLAAFVGRRVDRS